MKIADEKIKLKDGREIVIRSPKPEDAESLIEFMRVTAAETHFLLRYPEEINYTVEREREIITDRVASEDCCWFTVFDGDKAVGNCEVRRLDSRLRMRHRGELAIALEEAYCSLGLGTILLTKAIDKAKEFGFEQLELCVFADNLRAQGLYKKMGFKESGRLPRAFKMKDGTYIDDVNMVLFFKE